MYVAIQLEGASASLLVIEESADLYLSTVMRLIEHVLSEICVTGPPVAVESVPGVGDGVAVQRLCPCSLRTGIYCMTLPQTDMAHM